MSDEFDAFEDEDSDLPKKLRAKIKELTKERDELASKFEAFEAEKRSQNLQQTLQARGLNPKIAAFVPKDIENEGLDAWLEEYGDVFGGQPQTTGQADPRSAEINRMNAVDQGVNHSVPTADVMARIEQAENMDELMAALGQGR